MGVNGTEGSAGALRRAAERGTRKTGWRAALFLVAAIGAALGVAALLTRYMEARTAAARVPTVPVVVSDVDLPEATELRPETLKVVQWPQSSVPVGTASVPASLKGRVLMTRLVKGEPVLERHLAAADAGRGLAALLPEGMRAVSVRVNDVVGVAGFIHPGDSVDVIVTLRPADGIGKLPISMIVLQNIRVLAVGKQVERERDQAKAIPATVATLMVDSEQSERLALASNRGELLLTLRGGLDKEVVATSGIVPPELIRRDASDPAPAAPPASNAAKKAAPKKVAARTTTPERAPERDTVEILRGDLFERRSFEKGSP